MMAHAMKALWAGSISLFTSVMTRFAGNMIAERSFRNSATNPGKERTVMTNVDYGFCVIQIAYAVETAKEFILRSLMECS